MIALTGGPDGPISLALSADQAALAASRCDRLTSLFGDRLYIELQRHGIEKERRVEAGLIDLAYTKGLPLVATNEPYFATADDYEAHDALLCIAGGRVIAETERDQLTPDHRFKTRAEMAVLFADVPEALASTVEIAERCAFRPVTRDCKCCFVRSTTRHPVGDTRGDLVGNHAALIVRERECRCALRHDRYDVGAKPESVSRGTSLGTCSAKPIARYGCAVYQQPRQKA